MSLILAMHGGNKHTDPKIIIPFVIFGIAIVIVSILWSSRVERKSRARMSDVANSLGLKFVADMPLESQPELADFWLLGQGHSKRARNVAKGVHSGEEVCLIDYRYEMGSGKNRKYYRNAMFFFPEPTPQLPHFFLRPEGLGSKIAQLFGRQDIDFDGSKAEIRFSKHYQLQGDDEYAVREAFRRAAELLADHPGWWAEARSGRLMIWKPNWGLTFFGVRPAEEVVALFEEAKSIRDLLNRK